MYLWIKIKLYLKLIFLRRKIILGSKIYSLGKKNPKFALPYSDLP